MNAATADKNPPDATVFLGFGANVGETIDTLAAAVFAVDDIASVRVDDVSGVYCTPPWPPPDDPRSVTQQEFHNLVTRITTSLTPTALLDELQAIEAAFGRDRSRETRWGPRLLDIDILLFGNQTIETDRLAIPHPHLHERAFVVVPLMEVFPGGALPDGRRLTQLALALDLTEIDLVLRFEDMPGRIGRPAGPAGPGPSFNRPVRDDVAQRHGKQQTTDGP